MFSLSLPALVGLSLEPVLLRLVMTVSLACLTISRACSLASRRRLSSFFFFFLVGELGMDMYCAALSSTLSLSTCSDSLGRSTNTVSSSHAAALCTADDVDARGVSGSDRDRASPAPTLQLRLRSGCLFEFDGGC